MTLRVAPAAFAVLFICASCHLRPLLHPAYHTDQNFRETLGVVKLAAASETPRLEMTEDLNQTTREWLRKGYVRIGGVNLRTTDPVPHTWLRNQAEAARADVVLAHHEFLGSFQTTASTPFGGTLIPVTLHRYRLTASFLRKVDRTVFGAQAEELSNEDRFDLQRAGGAKIVAVTVGSVAERAGLRVDDVIVNASGRNIMTVRDLLQAQADLAGQTVTLQILRDGAPLEMKVPFLML